MTLFLVTALEYLGLITSPHIVTSIHRSRRALFPLHNFSDYITPLTNLYPSRHALIITRHLGYIATLTELLFPAFNRSSTSGRGRSPLKQQLTFPRSISHVHRISQPMRSWAQVIKRIYSRQSHALMSSVHRI